jgi:iron complex outermembrane recepter protein
VNLFFKYDVPSQSKLLQNLSFTLNVNNVFDQDPPVYLSTPDSGYTYGFTLGRLVMIGASKKF